jgi:hypothetical protein
MSRSAERWTWPSEQFLFGANLPWIDYGCDFGASAWFPDGGLGARPDAMARLDAVMDRLAADAVFDTAAVRGMRLLPVLFDFHLCDAAQVVNGVQIGGRGMLLADPVRRERLISTVVRPVAERYGEHPGIAAWDLFNEPEWCTRLFPPAWGTRVVPFARMRECLGQMANCVHACARQPVTVGSASAAHLDLVRGLGLDFYQVHWYERSGWAALAEPVDRFDLDRPVLLGEFPGRGAGVTPADIVSTARRAGYAGAFIWSVVSQDSASGYTEGLAIEE